MAVTSRYRIILLDILVPILYVLLQADSTIYGVIQSLVSVEEYKKKGNLDLYEEIFKKPFLAATGEFYREEAAKLLGEGRWGRSWTTDTVGR